MQHLTKLEIAKATLELVRTRREEYLCITAILICGRGCTNTDTAIDTEPNSLHLFERIQRHLRGHSTFGSFHRSVGLPAGHVYTYKARVEFMENLIKEWENE